MGRGRGGRECKRAESDRKELCFLLGDGEGTGLSETSRAFVSGHTLVDVSWSPASSENDIEVLSRAT